ncbi:hypothetical protein U0070_024767, partial [Myodes glareolus]
LHLTYWNSPTTAQITVEAVPPHVVEGEEVLLLVCNLPGSFIKFFWNIENHENPFEIGIHTTGTPKFYPNGSLLFQNITRYQGGLYRLWVKINQKKTEYRNVQVNVH